MNWKLIVIGGIVFYIVTFAVSFVTGPVVHNGILNETYQENWRPELNQDPPDMASLMPRWITSGVITSMIFAAIFGWIRPALGVGWLAGFKFGVILTLVAWSFMAGYSGVFNLPDKLWIVWGLETPFYHLPAGAVLGWLGEKLAPR